MLKDVFSREENVLLRAKELLRGDMPPEESQAFCSELASEYRRLFRQTQRVEAMGDRFQRSLNDLNQRLAASEERYRSIFENMVEGVFRTGDELPSSCALHGAEVGSGPEDKVGDEAKDGSAGAAGNAAGGLHTGPHTGPHTGLAQSFAERFAERVVEANPALAAMFGCAAPAEFLERNAGLGALFANAAEREAFFTQLAKDGEARALQAEMLRPDGSRFWAQLSARVQREKVGGCGEQNPVQGAQPVVGVVVDVSERRRMLDEIYRLARTDSLTGLWNRGYFMELACRELARNRRDAAPLSLIMIDVDHFKKVNDTHGHEAGDEALRCLAEVLALSVREGDLLARLGGEEFVALLPNARLDDACNVAERIRQGIAARELDCRSGACFGLTVSVGVATHRDRETPLEELLRCADEALYAAKRGGRDRVEIFGGAR